MITMFTGGYFAFDLPVDYGTPGLSRLCQSPLMKTEAVCAHTSLPSILHTFFPPSVIMTVLFCEFPHKKKKLSQIF